MQRPGVGVLVILKYNNTVLLGKRKGSHGDGEWSFHGWHLELNETIEEYPKSIPIFYGNRRKTWKV
jgi:ADP-ribose pyrophosphatase YjhB (NUDIX family)